MPPGPAGGARRPNVVFIVTDDQEFDTIGCYEWRYGLRRVWTPHQDRLAAEGVRFNRMYTTTSLCTPSRYGCLTGQFPSRCPHPGFQDAFPPGTQTGVGFNTHLSANIMSLPRALQQAGYRTGMVGKWHLGSERMAEAGFGASFARDTDPRDPTLERALARHQQRAANLVQACGFDDASRIHWNNPASYGIDALDAHNLEWTIEGALHFLDANRDRPFFLYVATTLHHVPHPHGSLRNDPRISLGGYLDRPPQGLPPRNEVLGRVKAAGYDPGTAHCTYLDDGVGAILERLDALGLADDTVVVLFSDNGVLDKATLYEAGVHVPALLRWPRGVRGGQVCDRLAQNLDLAPTLLEICGVHPPPGPAMDGRSLLPMLQGRAPATHDALFFELGRSRAVCTQRWKYLALRYPTPPETNVDRYHGCLPALQAAVRLRHPAYFAPDQLYDLADDPDETTDRAIEEPDRLEDMRQRLRTWLASFEGHPFGELCVSTDQSGVEESGC